MEPVIDLDDLARRVAARLDPDSLLDGDDVGAMLKCTGRYVLEHYAKVDTFPMPVRLSLPGGRRSQPRWRRREVQDWIDGHATGRPKKVGRPRKNH